MSNFEKAFQELLGNEGNFKKESTDRMDWTGGQVGSGKLVGTKYGISAGTYPTLDIPNLTLAQARAIYKRDFWDKFRGDEFDYEIAFQVLDAAVNHSMDTAKRFMQRALGVKDDGVMGPITISALHAMDPNVFNMLFLAERLEYFTKIKTWDTYGRGWARRVAINMRKAVTE